MTITRVKIENFKIFRSAEIPLSRGMNILVGSNEAGKSTLLEAIHLACTGYLGSRPLRAELSQHLFNAQAVSEYLHSLTTAAPQRLPRILIEVFLAPGSFPELEGDGNSERTAAPGCLLSIHPDEEYRQDYETLFSTGKIRTLPIEYYTTSLRSFARSPLTPRGHPFRSVLIDSSALRNTSGSDAHISRIVRDFLQPAEAVAVAQAYREMAESFGSHTSLGAINEKISSHTEANGRKLTLEADLPTKGDWSDGVVACLDGVPFPNVGMGTQNVLKTKLALGRQTARDAAVVLLEEPENHLTHARLNRLLSDIASANPGKQFVVSTHSSFVANKLGLDSLTLLRAARAARFSRVSASTMQFFKRVAGYDTLRLLLCERAILVEGASDELVVQKAYERTHGVPPLAREVDVISVGTAFLRFLELADQVDQHVAVVTDNDGKPEALLRKYAKYLGEGATPRVRICFDQRVDTGPELDGRPYNYNTLEPKLLRRNGLAAMNAILGTSFGTDEELLLHMSANKTECALAVLETSHPIVFPDYILDAVR